MSSLSWEPNERLNSWSEKLIDPVLLFSNSPIPSRAKFIADRNESTDGDVTRDEGCKDYNIPASPTAPLEIGTKDTTINERAARFILPHQGKEDPTLRTSKATIGSGAISAVGNGALTAMDSPGARKQVRAGPVLVGARPQRLLRLVGFQCACVCMPVTHRTVV